jgi:hypothetical protein
MPSPAAVHRSAAFERACHTRTTSPSCGDAFGMLLAAAPCTLETI